MTSRLVSNVFISLASFPSLESLRNDDGGTKDNSWLKKNEFIFTCLLVSELGQAKCAMSAFKSK